MTVDDIQKMIADNEGDVFEYKATTGQRVEGCRTLCAFLNGRGGTVVFGVTKEGKLQYRCDISDNKKNNPDYYVISGGKEYKYRDYTDYVTDNDDDIDYLND